MRAYIHVCAYVSYCDCLSVIKRDYDPYSSDACVAWLFVSVHDTCIFQKNAVSTLTTAAKLS